MPTTGQKMTFDADASGVAQAYEQMGDSGQKMSRQTIDAMANVAKSVKAVTDQLMANNVATKRLVDQKENLRKKLDELKRENESLGKSFEDTKRGFEGIVTAIAGSEIVKYILEIAEAQEKWNKSVVQTQVEYDKVARKTQVQTMMNSEEFATLRKDTLEPLRKQYRMSNLSQVTELYSALQSQGLDEKQIPDVMKQVIEGGRAIPGMADDQLADFGIAMVRRLQQQGVGAGDITAAKMSQTIVPATNIAGGMRVRSGAEFMAMQEQVGGLGEAEGLNQDELMAEVAALTPHVGKEKAMQGIQRIITGLKSERGQKAMGDVVAKAFNEQLEKGSAIGAFTTLGDALNQLPAEEKEKKLNELFPKREAIVGRQLIAHQGDALQVMKGMGDRSRIAKAQEIYGSGAASMDEAIKGQEQDVQINQGEIAEKNEALIRLFDVEMQKRGYSAFRRGLETKFAGYLAGRGDDLSQTFGRTAAQEQRGEMPGDLYSKTLERYAEIKKAREMTVVRGGEAQVAVPQVQHQMIPGAFQETPAEKEIRELKNKVIQLEEQVLKEKQAATSKDSPGGEKITKHEEKKIKIAEQQLDIQRRQLAIAEQKQKQAKPAKNGMNL